ncbi:hypothetical protein [uncultured Gammaproteobacteria bacterium]|nr:hypothetical protein [uncultured Gammaproteobacteria bacterium]
MFQVMLMLIKPVVLPLKIRQKKSSVTTKIHWIFFNVFIC